MLHKSPIRILASIALLAVLVLTSATPALAFDGRGGQNVTIAAGDVVDDDLYITAQTVVVDGTVKGDLVVFASHITINGTVDGDVMAAGEDVVVNGTVGGSVRMAGAALQVGEKAGIGGDLISAGASLETRPGSTIGRDAVFGGGQVLLAGAVARNGLVATSGLEVKGTIGRNLTAYVGNSDQSRGGTPGRYMAGTGLALPSVETGLVIDPGARIAGNLDYTSAKTIEPPAGTVTGKLTHTLPKASSARPAPPTPLQSTINAGLDILRLAITLVLLGLLLIRFFPAQIKAATGQLKTAPMQSLAGGVLSLAAFCFGVLALVIATAIGATLFGVLTLGTVGWTILWVGLFLLFALVFGFILMTAFVSQVIVGTLTGQWVLARFNMELAASKYWPMVLGVVLYALLASIPIVGVLLWWIVILFGLGAVWFYGRQLFEKKPVPLA